MQLKTKLNLIYLSEFFVFFHLVSGVLIPFFMIWGGLTLTQVMLLQAWFSLGILIFEIPTGTLADLIGRKKTILLGIFINAIGVILYGLYRDIYVFFIAETLWALSFALFSGAKEALLYDTLLDHDQEKQSKKALSNFKISHLVALMIGAPVGSWIAQAYGLNWTMLLMVIPLSLSALILLLLPEPRSHQLAEGERRAPFYEQMQAGWKFFRKHPFLGIMTFDMVLIWTLAFMIIWFQQVVLTDLNVDIKHFGWFVTFGLFAQIIILKFYPAMEKWFGSKKAVLKLTGILPGVGFLLLAYFPSVIMVLFALVLVGGFGLSRRIIFVNYMNKFISSRQRATVNSFINIGISLAGVLIKPLSGFLADYNLTLALAGLGVACILVTLFSRVEEEMLLD